MKRVLYLGQKPSTRTGSPIVLLRHLSRLQANGVVVDVCYDFGEQVEESDLFQPEKFYRLPLRKRLWPPFRKNSELSRSLQTRLWARELNRMMSLTRYDAIITYMAWHSDLFAEIGGRIGQLTGVAVTCLVHDNSLDFNPEGQRKQLRCRQNRILNLNTKNAFVCESLRKSILNNESSVDLWPIPEGTHLRKASSSEAISELELYYAGYLWPVQAKLLARLVRDAMGASVNLRVAGVVPDESRKILMEASVEIVPTFETNEEALEYLITHASALIVLYGETVEDLPFSRSSFPSKLIEYSHLGKPILIVAPAETAVSEWAFKKNLNCCYSPADKKGIRDWLSQMLEEDTRTKEVNKWKAQAAEEWNPDVIHEKFESMLFS